MQRRLASRARPLSVKRPRGRKSVRKQASRARGVSAECPRGRELQRKVASRARAESRPRGGSALTVTPSTSFCAARPRIIAPSRRFCAVLYIIFAPSRHFCAEGLSHSRPRRRFALQNHALDDVLRTRLRRTPSRRRVRDPTSPGGRSPGSARACPWRPRAPACAAGRRCGSGRDPSS